MCKAWISIPFDFLIHSDVFSLSAVLRDGPESRKPIRDAIPRVTLFSDVES